MSVLCADASLLCAITAVGLHLVGSGSALAEELAEAECCSRWLRQAAPLSWCCPVSAHGCALEAEVAFCCLLLGRSTYLPSAHYGTRLSPPLEGDNCEVLGCGFSL